MSRLMEAQGQSKKKTCYLLSALFKILYEDIKVYFSDKFTV